MRKCEYSPDSPALVEAREAYVKARQAQREAYEAKKKADEILMDATKRYRAAMKGEPA